MTRSKSAYVLLVTLVVMALAGISFLPPITQNNSYHVFSDRETLLGIPNFMNVISNLPFLVVGIMGLWPMLKGRNVSINYFVFFVGILLVAFGSGYYHWQPTSQSLICDRLPMTLAFMSLLAILVSECIHHRDGQILLGPLLLLGIFSIYYWQKCNDLRLYVLVQFYPMLAMPLLLMFFKPKNKSTVHYWYLFGAYVLAKLCEHFDAELHTHLRVISGHSLKHLLVTIGLFAFTLGLKKSEDGHENLNLPQS